MPKLTAVPALRSQRRTLRAKQNIVFGLLGSLCLTGPLALLIVARQPDPYVPEPLPAIASTPTQVVAFAHQAAEDYLSGAGTLLPVGGEDVIDPDFDGLGDGVKPAILRSAIQLWSVEASSYTTGSGSATSWKTTFSFRLKQPDGANSSAMLLVIHVRLDKNNFPVLAAVPSLLTNLAPSRAVGGGVGLIGLSGKETSLPEPARVAVSTWARLYVADERAGLKAHVNSGSGQDNYEYQGLGGGFTLRRDPEVVIALDKGEGRLVARVRLDLEKGSYRVSTEVDVLILNQNPAFVQAWGAVGSGDDLAPWVFNAWVTGS